MKISIGTANFLKNYSYKNTFLGVKSLKKFLAY